MSLTWVVALREMRAYARQRRTFIAMLLLAAFLANAGRAVVLLSPLVRLSLVSRHAAGIHLTGYHDLAQSALVWIGLLPVLFSAQQAAITLAAERERRSLTALLATPISFMSILGGKLIGSFAVALVMVGVAYAVYLASLSATTPYAASWLPLPIVAAVLGLLLALSLLMNTIALLISAYAANVATASITATFVLLPLSFAIAVLSVKVSDLGPRPIAALALAAATGAALLLGLAGRYLSRGGLLVV